VTLEEHRARLEHAIEQAIELLNALDGDCDLEPDVKNGPGYPDDHEPDADFEPDDWQLPVSFHAGPTMRGETDWEVPFG
jgi:hypothetical protein